VVTADGTTGTPIASNTVLDGFTITAGQADGANEPNYYGGGFFCDGSEDGSECNPRLKNITFSGNFADSIGGAMCNLGDFGGTSSPYLTNVTFTGNSADKHGGAIFNSGGIGGTSNPNLSEVTFYNNSALLHGGAMYNAGNSNGNSSPSLNHVVFSSNSAGENGGAIYNNGVQGNSNPTLTNVAFYGNSAENNGGAMYNYGPDGSGEAGECSPNLRNVTFSGNAAQNGGAMFNDGRDFGISSPSLTNVTFSGNAAKFRSGGMYNFAGTGTSKPEVRNSIFWNNQDISGKGSIIANIRNSDATTTLTHSLVQGSGGSSSWIGGSYVDGGGNIDENPKFVSVVDPSTAPTIEGNLRLQIKSPAIDAGDNIHIAGVTTDLDGEPRIKDGNGDGTATVDMGAYEFGDVTYIPLIFR